MKKSYIILFYLLLFATLSSNAQSNDEVYLERYNKLKEYFLKQLDSEEYIYYTNLKYKFHEKLNHEWSKKERNELTTAILAGKKPLLDWIEANLAHTKFKDMDEARLEYSQSEKARLVEVEHNMDFYMYLKESMQIAGPEIYSELINDIMQTHPGKFHF